MLARMRHRVARPGTHWALQPSDGVCVTQRWGSWLVDDVVRQQLGAVEHIVRAAVADPAAFEEVHRQILVGRAKRLRPAIALLSARIGTESRPDLLVRAAAAVEILHEATLLHDDIVDHASSRRGVPTTAAKFGSRVSGVAGSRLLYRAAELGADLPARLREAIGTTSLRLSHGQLLEVLGAGDTSRDVWSRLRTADQKTASLFRLAAILGTGLGGAPGATTKFVVQYAGRVGGCLQLLDDLRDILAEPQALGREPGSDVRDGVYTLPLLLALRGGDMVGARLAEVVGGKQSQCDDEHVREALVLLARAPSTERCFVALEHWLERTYTLLDRIEWAGATAAGESLRSLIDCLRSDARDLRARRDEICGQPVRNRVTA